MEISARGRTRVDRDWRGFPHLPPRSTPGIDRGMVAVGGVVTVIEDQRRAAAGRGDDGQSGMCKGRLSDPHAQVICYARQWTAVHDDGRTGEAKNGYARNRVLLRRR